MFSSRVGWKLPSDPSLINCPEPGWRRETYQRALYPVGCGSRVLAPAPSWDQSTRSENFETSPEYSVSAWSSSIQKLPVTDRASPSSPSVEASGVAARAACPAATSASVDPSV